MLVMPLSKGSSMAVAFVLEPHGSLRAGRGALAAIGGACGGGGEGAADRRRRRTGAAGDVGRRSTDASTAGARQAARSELGEPCTTPSECASAQCVEGVCCNQACGGRLLHLQEPRHGRDLLAGAPGHRSRRSLPDRGRHQLRDDRRLRRHRRVRALQRQRRRRVCRRRRASASCARRPGRATARAGARGRRTQSCTPFQCATDGKTCRTTLHDGRRLRRAQHAASTAAAARSRSAPPAAPTPSATPTICAQGRCCSAACTGTCKSCAVAGSEGTCRNVPDGRIRSASAPTRAPTTCGLDGQCDGTGACRKYAANTVVRDGFVQRGRRARRPARCDATGTCAPGTLRSCSPYVCGTTNCKTSCATSADCVAGFTLHRQRLHAAGRTACRAPAPAMCTSGYCEQGVCCNTGCAATCVACNLDGHGRDLLARGRGHGAHAGHPVHRHGVARPAAPTASATAPAPAGSYAVGTACGAATCTGSTLSSPRSCDGAGACRPATDQLVRPVSCAATGACKTIVHDHGRRLHVAGTPASA